MTDLPADWSALCGVALLLGLRHGLDADHLAAIDGMTRLAHGGRRGFSRHCGALFALGHGAVVMAMAGLVGALGGPWSLPAWLEAVGGWISVVFLAVLGAVNLRAALRATPDAVVGLVGFKAALGRRLLAARSPWQAAAVGALFALSFDTLAQAALLAVAAARFGGPAHALALGAAFVGGMLAVDGLDGWWVAHLMSCADRLAARVSRVMAYAVAGVSLLVAAFGAARLLSPVMARWSSGQGLLLGLGVTAVLGASFVASGLWAQRRRARRESRLAAAALPRGSAGC